MERVEQILEEAIAQGKRVKCADCENTLADRIIKDKISERVVCPWCARRHVMKGLSDYETDLVNRGVLYNVLDEMADYQEIEERGRNPIVTGIFGEDFAEETIKGQIALVMKLMPSYTEGKLWEMAEARRGAIRESYQKGGHES